MQGQDWFAELEADKEKDDSDEDEEWGEYGDWRCAHSESWTINFQRQVMLLLCLSLHVQACYAQAQGPARYVQSPSNCR